MPLYESLCDSARRWATTALDAYSEQPPDHDFAVHHMAVAVEHLSKAYLCSVDEVLLVGERPDTDDLLILAGHESRVKRQLPDVKTISGDLLSKRVAAVLGRSYENSSKDLQRLRAVRNGVAHLGLGEAPTKVRELLVAGIAYLNDLLTKLGQPTAVFWGEHEALSMLLVEQTVTERQLRYEGKLRSAREIFERRFSGMNEWQSAKMITAVSSIPYLVGLWVPPPAPHVAAQLWCVARSTPRSMTRGSLATGSARSISVARCAS